MTLKYFNFGFYTFALTILAVSLIRNKKIAVSNEYNYKNRALACFQTRPCQGPNLLPWRGSGRPCSPPPDRGPRPGPQ